MTVTNTERRKHKDGFKYSCSEEKLRESMALSAKDKLDWLEEANRFTYKTLTPETKKIREAFRSGSI